MRLTIRNFQPGDEEKQVAIWNAAAAALPGFKAATAVEVRRRTSARTSIPRCAFLPSRLGRSSAIALNANGRVGFPWCMPGYDAGALLLDAAVDAGRKRGLPRLFTAYRADWTAPSAFFEKNGFAKVPRDGQLRPKCARSADDGRPPWPQREFASTGRYTSGRRDCARCRAPAGCRSGERVVSQSVLPARIAVCPSPFGQLDPGRRGFYQQRLLCKPDPY